MNRQCTEDARRKLLIRWLIVMRISSTCSVVVALAFPITSSCFTLMPINWSICLQNYDFPPRVKIYLNTIFTARRHFNRRSLYRDHMVVRQSQIFCVPISLKFLRNLFAQRVNYLYVSDILIFSSPSSVVFDVTIRLLIENQVSSLLFRTVTSNGTCQHHTSHSATEIARRTSIVDGTEFWMLLDEVVEEECSQKKLLIPLRRSCSKRKNAAAVVVVLSLKSSSRSRLLC